MTSAEDIVKFAVDKDSAWFWAEHNTEDLKRAVEKAKPTHDISLFTGGHGPFLNH